MAAAKAGAPTRPPPTIEDFLWNLHSVLVATPGPLVLDGLKDAYSKHLGHKCIIERFLVVGDGGLAATLKRIPHMVTLFNDDAGTLCVKATQPSDITKQQLIDADSAYRRELIKKNAAAKARAGTAAKAPAAAAPPKAAGGTAAAPPPAAAAQGAAEPASKAAAPAAAVGDKRPQHPDGGTASPEAKKPRTGTGGSDVETLGKMLVQGVVRVLQNRVKAGKGPLPLSELEEEFKVQWKLPFNPQQAGEKDAISFLQKWSHKVELYHDGTQQLVQLPKNKPKAGAPEEAAPKKAGDGGAPAKAAVGATSTVQPGPKGPPAPASAGAKSPATGTAAKAPAKGPPPSGAPAVKGPPPAKGAPATAAPAAGVAAANGPTRPPALVEDFLWNVHTVIDAYGGPMPVDQLKDAYSKRLGHKCAIERFLVVGDGGLAATLKRIPHVVTVEQKDGTTVLKPSLPSGTTKEGLIAADHQYRRQLAQKNAAAAKAKAAAAPAAEAAAPAEVPGAPEAVQVQEAKAPAAASTGQARPAAEPAAGEKDAKKPRSEEADTLARMLVQGVVRVLQNRRADGKGALPIVNLEEEFKALWKVPFNLQQAGETDAVSFLNKWGKNKVEVLKAGDGGFVVQLAKKAAEKAKAGAGTAGPPPAQKASAPAAAPAKAAAAPSAALPAAQAAGATAAPVSAAAAAEAAAAATEAAEVLAQMHEMVRRQEALVDRLRQLGEDLKG